MQTNFITSNKKTSNNDSINLKKSGEVQPKAPDMETKYPQILITYDSDSNFISEQYRVLNPNEYSSSSFSQPEAKPLKDAIIEMFGNRERGDDKQTEQQKELATNNYQLLTQLVADKAKIISDQAFLNLFKTLNISDIEQLTIYYCDCYEKGAGHTIIYLAFLFELLDLDSLLIDVLNLAVTFDNSCIAAAAKHKLAKCNLNGVGVTPDVEKAVQLFEEAANLKQPDSNLYLGIYYLLGIEGMRNHDQNSFYLESTVKPTNNEVIEKHKKAFYYFKLAADQGCIYALNYYGYCLKNAIGNDGNRTKAFEKFKSGAKAGDPKATYSQAYMLEQTGKEAYIKAALGLYQEAALSGLSHANFKIAQIYRKGLLGEPDLNKASQYYLLAAKSNDLDAQKFVANFYEHGQYGFKLDLNEAIFWHTRAIKQGHEPSIELAFRIFYNKMISQDNLPLSAFIFVNACRPTVKAGSLTASHFLGLFYLNNYDGEENKVEALNLISFAAKGGNPNAMQNLGSYYLKANDPLYDKQYGLEWLKKAASQGSESALQELAKEYFKGELGAKNDAKSNISLLRQVINYNTKKMAPELFQTLKNADPSQLEPLLSALSIDYNRLNYETKQLLKVDNNLESKKSREVLVLMDKDTDQIKVILEKDSVREMLRQSSELGLHDDIFNKNTFLNFQV